MARDFRHDTEAEPNMRTSSATVAEREPVAFTSDVALEMMRDHWQKINVIGASRFASPVNNIPLYLDPPPTSELEAENARLRAERDVAVAAMVRNNERANAAEARLAEALKAFDAIIERSNNDPLGTSKVNDMRRIAEDAARRVREGGKVDG